MAEITPSSDDTQAVAEQAMQVLEQAYGSNIEQGEQAAFESGLPQPEAQPEAQPAVKDPYEGLSPMEITIKKREEALFEHNRRVEQEALEINNLKAQLAKDKAAYATYDALMAYVAGNDPALVTALDPHKEITMQAIREGRIQVGDAKPVQASGSIGLHSSSNGSRIIGTATLPATREPVITPEIAKLCRQEYIEGRATRKELAARYGVTAGYMGNVLNNRRGNG